MAAKGGSYRAVAGFHSAGFTLLEIMVAMLLLTVIITSSVSLLFMNIRSWDALVSDSETALDETLIQDRLASILRHLSPIVWQTGGERRLAFRGESDRVQFISEAPLQYRNGALFEYLLVQEFDSDNRENLILYYSPYHPGQTEFRLPQEGFRRPLIIDTGGVGFTYLGVREQGRQADWWEQWESGASDYPIMVRIDIAGMGSGENSRGLTVPLLLDRREPIR